MLNSARIFSYTYNLSFRTNNFVRSCISHRFSEQNISKAQPFATHHETEKHSPICKSEPALFWLKNNFEQQKVKYLSELNHRLNESCCGEDIIWQWEKLTLNYCSNHPTVMADDATEVLSNFESFLRENVDDLSLAELIRCINALACWQTLHDFKRN